MTKRKQPHGFSNSELYAYGRKLGIRANTIFGWTRNGPPRNILALLTYIRNLERQLDNNFEAKMTTEYGPESEEPG